MTDFGSSRKRKRSAAPAMAVVALACLAAIAAGLWFVNRSREIAKAEAWTISGPPCPAATAEAFAAYVEKPRSAFEFGGVTFLRDTGQASCERITNDGGRGFGSHPVCQFTAPGVLQVNTRKGRFYFIVPTGPATVTVRNEAPACVRAARFHGEPGAPTDL